MVTAVGPIRPRLPTHAGERVTGDEKKPRGINHDLIPKAETVFVFKTRLEAEKFQALFPETAAITVLKTDRLSILKDKIITLSPGAIPDPRRQDLKKYAREIFILSENIILDSSEAATASIHTRTRYYPSELMRPDTDQWIHQVDWVEGKHPVTISTHRKFLERNSLHNALLMILGFAPRCLIYNIFQDDIFLINQPPWQPQELQFKPHAVREEEYTYIRMWLEKTGLKLGLNDVCSVVQAIARRHTINPPKEYFETLEWDQHPRLKNWLAYYMGAEKEPPLYLQAVGTKWMVGAVARIYEPGCKFDTALFLEGRQGIGKSRSLKELATFNSEVYFTDQNIDFNNKDSLLILQGKLIIEMAELVSFRRSDINEIKAFISRDTDHYRPPYARSTVSRPRMFVIAGSHNPDGDGIFTDRTGNRRYWPVTCGKNIDVDAIAKDKQQLWAEAVYLYKNHHQIWLNLEEENLAVTEQQERLQEDPLLADVQHAIREIQALGSQNFTTNQILAFLKIPAERKTSQIVGKFKQTIISLGYYETRRRDETGKRPSVWILTDTRSAKRTSHENTYMSSRIREKTSSAEEYEAMIGQSDYQGAEIEEF